MHIDLLQSILQVKFGLRALGVTSSFVAPDALVASVTQEMYKHKKQMG